MSLENKFPDAVIAKINIESWRSSSTSEEDRTAILDQWDRSFSSSGLVYLTHHGLGDLYRRVAEEWRRFYSRPLEVKEKFSAIEYGFTGYNRMGKEAVVLSNDETDKDIANVGDPVESMYCPLKNSCSDGFVGQFPRSDNGYDGGDDLRDACIALCQGLDDKVIRPCLNIATKALAGSDLETYWFNEGLGANALRLARYVPRQENTQEILYGEHTDYDGFTYLWRNKSNGLQALDKGIWYNVPVPADDRDALVINLGDLMEVWTRGAWHSPRHRVLRTRTNPSLDQSSDAPDLVSIVHFTGPHAATKLLPLQSPRLPPFQDGGPIITAGQHVKAKIAKTAL